jgi:hypothetical protein
MRYTHCTLTVLVDMSGLMHCVKASSSKHYIQSLLPDDSVHAVDTAL